MGTRFCTVCGAQLLEGARFCSKCRHEIEQEEQPQQVEMSGYCVKCGAPLIKGAAFCSKCREAVDSSAPAAHGQSAAQQFADIQNPFSQDIAAAAARPVMNIAPRYIKAARISGGTAAVELGSIQSIAGRAKSKISIPSVLTGLGVCGAGFAVLRLLPYRLIISAAVAALSLVRIIYVKVRGGRRR